MGSPKAVLWLESYNGQRKIRNLTHNAVTNTSSNMTELHLFSPHMLETSYIIVITGNKTFIIVIFTNSKLLRTANLWQSSSWPSKHLSHYLLCLRPHRGRTSSSTLSVKIWHLVATILMIFRESTDQISCTLKSKGQPGPKLAQTIYYWCK